MITIHLHFLKLIRSKIECLFFDFWIETCNVECESMMIKLIDSWNAISKFVASKFWVFLFKHFVIRDIIFSSVKWNYYLFIVQTYVMTILIRKRTILTRLSLKKLIVVINNSIWTVLVKLFIFCLVSREKSSKFLIRKDSFESIIIIEQHDKVSLLLLFFLLINSYE